MRDIFLAIHLILELVRSALWWSELGTITDPNVSSVTFDLFQLISANHYILLKKKFTSVFQPQHQSMFIPKNSNNYLNYIIYLTWDRIPTEVGRGFIYFTVHLLSSFETITSTPTDRWFSITTYAISSNNYQQPLYIWK